MSTICQGILGKNFLTLNYIYVIIETSLPKEG